jgi:hypothetical protein
MAKPPIRFFQTALISLILASYAWVAWTATLGKSPAFDESAHLTAGYSYWKFNDYRLQPENGNLPQRWAGLSLMPLAPKLNPSATADPWAKADVWTIGQHLLYEDGNSPEILMATGRAAMTLWGVAAGLLVFGWSRSLWGMWGALLSLALCAGSATMLAHGPLITSDMTAAFCLLAATGAFWRYQEKPCAVNLGLSLLLTGATALAKFSFVLLVPIYTLLLVWHQFTYAPSPVTTSPFKRRCRVFLKTTGLVLAHSLVVLLMVWAAFGFRYEAEAPGMPTGVDLYVPWNDLLPDNGLKREMLMALKEHRILPEAYTHGFAYVLRASEARGAFAAGQVGTTGWWWFFPYAFLLKSSLAELLSVTALFIFSIHRWIISKRSHRLQGDLRKIAPLVTLVMVYGAASVFSSLNIGHRHILPLYLPLFIMAGALLRPAAKKMSRAVAIALVMLHVTETTYAYPNYLAYFNPMAGSPDQRWRHLVDSSLDWGQELPALADWLKIHRQPREHIFLSYFGVGDPRREGIYATQFAPYSSFWREPSLAKLEPGIYCISATLLQDSYSPFNGAWSNKLENTFWLLASYFADHSEEFQPGHSYTLRRGTLDEKRRWLFDRIRFARLAQYLRVRHPDDVINSSILIYRLDQREIALAIDAPTSSFRNMIEEAFADR